MRLPGFSAQEQRTTLVVSLIVGLRMFGMFCLLPVFALYARDLSGGQDALWVGIALGIYGLAQALLQIPFGWASDRWGRRPLLLLGLLLMVGGSVVSALASDIYLLALGRLLQGAGAVSGVLSAVLADTIGLEQRSLAFAVMGTSIGLMFVLALALAPLLVVPWGLSGLLWQVAALGVLCLLLLPQLPLSAPVPPPAEGKQRWWLAPLKPWFVAVFVMHGLLSALFLALPLDLLKLGFEREHQGQFLLPVVLVSLVLTVIWLGRSKPKLGQVFKPLLLLALAQALLYGWPQSLVLVAAAAVLFLVGFNVLEASLPTWLSQLAPASARGTTLGAYASLQFLGAFSGAVAAGWLLRHQVAVYGWGLILVVIWSLASWRMLRNTGISASFES